MERSIIHIDVNSAFLSWTALELLANGHPEDIREVPSAIAGDPKNRHGIILAKSTSAKKFGIQTAMTINEALRRCPKLKLFPPNKGLYSKRSDEMYNLLCEYSDTIERFSIDECWMDYTGSIKLFGPTTEIAEIISNRIKNELGFTVNIGISTNKLLAKMASEFEKPDKIHTLYPEEIPSKLWPLPASELFGVGRATVKKLDSMNIHTIEDIAKTDINILISAFKPAYARNLHDSANGIDLSPVMKRDVTSPKSIGNSITTDHDINNDEEAFSTLLYLCEKSCKRLRKTDGLASIVSVQLKNKNFDVYQHQKKLDRPTSSTDVIFETSKKIFKEMWRGDELRLFGVTLSGFTNDFTEQYSLFNDSSIEEESILDDVSDKINAKFGEKSLTRGSLIKVAETNEDSE